MLEHPDAPSVVMAYLLSLDISDWNPQDIHATKMKTDTMTEHLANPIRFIIDHISSWSENMTEKPICSNLYQDYRIWCERNGENLFTSKKFGKTLPTIGIERKQVRINGKREWVYILDRSKIVAKLRESVGDIEEFSDASQTETSSNASTDIPVFNVPEIVDPKGHCFAINPRPEKIDPILLTTNRIKKGKERVSTPPIPKMTQDLFDSMSNESSVASSSGSIAKQAVRRFSESWDFVPTNISMSPEIVDDKSKSPEISLDLPMNNEPKNSTEVSPQQISYPLGYQTREQREIRLRQKAIELGEDPDKFVTITEKDRDLARIYYDKMMADAEIIEFARSDGVDPENYMELSRREKLICMEIDLRLYEDKGEPRAYTCIYNDEDWAKNIEILRENGYLW